MSSQGLEVIDHTIQETHEWVNELRERLEWESSRDALRLLRATLVQVRDHLGHAEVAQFAAQMPILLRGMFYEGWRPSNTPLQDRSAAHFMAAIEERLGDVPDWRGEQDLRAVFRTLDHRISAGEIAHVRASLPHAIRQLWPH